MLKKEIIGNSIVVYIYRIDIIIYICMAYVMSNTKKQTIVVPKQVVKVERSKMGRVRVSLPSLLFLMVAMILISSSCNQVASQSQNAAAAPIKCCFDNHMPNCIDTDCDTICSNNGCSKGGKCKLINNLHYCHCKCWVVLFVFNLFIMLLRRHSITCRVWCQKKITCRVCFYLLFLIKMSMYVPSSTVSSYIVGTKTNKITHLNYMNTASYVSHLYHFIQFSSDRFFFFFLSFSFS